MTHTDSETEKILQNFLATQATTALANQRRAVLDRVAGLLSTGHDARTYAWSSVTPDQVAYLRGEFEKMDMKPRTVRFQLQTLRAYLTRLHEAGLLDAVQLANVRRVPCPPQQARGHAGRRLSREEIALVLSDKGQLPVDRFMRAAFFVLVTTGMRISEMLALPADCMGKEGRIELIQKGSRAHTVWITKPVLQVLRLHWQDVPDRDHLVQWPGSKQILRNNFDRELKKLADRVGIEHFTPHDLRRTVATSLLEKGIDPYVLSSILGHSKPETTAIYDRRPDAVKQQAIQDMVETIEEGKIIYSAPLGILSQGKG